MEPVWIRQDVCSGCGYCALVCPAGAISLDGHASLADGGRTCTACGVCVDACPNLAIEGRRPPRKPDWPERCDTIVVGAGIGGLMAAARLARRGEKIVVFEQLPFAGGRYTEIPHRGYRVTTGAWSNAGPQSKIGQFVESVGGRVEYLRPEAAQARGRIPFPVKVLVPGGGEVAGPEGVLDPDEIGAFLEVASGTAAGAGEKESAGGFLRARFRHATLVDIVNAAVGVASGLTTEELPSAELLRIVREAVRVSSTVGFPRGGTRSLVEALGAAVRAAGGSIHLGARVRGLVVESGRVRGVELDAGVARAGRVVWNGGVRRLAEMAGDAALLPASYTRRIDGLVPVRCGAIVLGARRPLFPRTPIACTIRTRRVAGIFEPTLFDPSAAPPGRHLYDVFFLVRGGDNREELGQAMADLDDLFPGWRGSVDLVVPMLFTGRWPGAETAQTFGQTELDRFDPATPVPGLFLVGMDCVGSGIAGDLIPDGVERLVEGLAPGG